MRKGFTLIELLIVIGLVAVMAAGALSLIDPVEKTRQANDANVQGAIAQVAVALQSFAAQQGQATYPTSGQWNSWGSNNILVTTGDLVTLPPLPNGYTGVYLGGAAAPVVNTGLYVNLTSKKYVDGKCGGSNAYWYWTNIAGRACGKCGVVPVVSDDCSAAPF